MDADPNSTGNDVDALKKVAPPTSENIIAPAEDLGTFDEKAHQAFAKRVNRMALEQLIRIQTSFMTR